MSYSVGEQKVVQNLKPQWLKAKMLLKNLKPAQQKLKMLKNLMKKVSF